MVEGSSTQFKVCDPKGDILLTGERGTNINDPDTGKTVSKIDFSRLNTPGDYYLYYGDARRDLVIGGNPYNNALLASLKTFNIQRCGIEVKDIATGYSHEKCHMQDANFLPSAGKNGGKNVRGGWHDAGDYGKYVPPANYAVSTLLFSYELNKKKLKRTGLLKEIRYEVDWLLTMQDEKTGGVYHKVARKDFEPFIQPDRDKEPRYISQISSAATAGFAGTMAQAYQAFREYDQRYANKLLAAAKHAWQYLEENPTIVPSGGFNNDPGIKTGIYGDDVDGDERIFAAAQLLGATGDPKYEEYFSRNFEKFDSSDTARLGWQDFRHHAYISYLLLPEKWSSAEISSKVKQRFISFAEKLVERANKNGFGVVFKGDDYRWGSNGLLMDYAKALVFAHIFTSEKRFKELSLEQLHYIFGRNANDICFVTGFGERSVTRLHHRPSIARGRELPGYMAGGPNKYLQDERVRGVFNSETPPAMVYLDDKDSYSTNENSIYWNASLFFILGYFSD